MANNELVTVVAKVGKDKNAHNRVVLWEKNPDHPNGEAFVVRDNNPVEIALTPKVRELLGNGDLERTTAKPKPEPVVKTQENDDDDNSPDTDVKIPSTIRRGRPPRPEDK
jgi:hypothetical protein